MSALMPRGTARSRLAKGMINLKAARRNLGSMSRRVNLELALMKPCSYLDQLLLENRRLKEQSVTSADAAEAMDPPNTERYVTSTQ